MGTPFPLPQGLAYAPVSTWMLRVLNSTAHMIMSVHCFSGIIITSDRVTWSELSERQLKMPYIISTCIVSYNSKSRGRKVYRVGCFGGSAMSMTTPWPNSLSFSMICSLNYLQPKTCSPHVHKKAVSHNGASHCFLVSIFSNYGTSMLYFNVIGPTYFMFHSLNQW